MGKYTHLMLQTGASYVLAFDVSQNMVEGAKSATDKFLLTHRLIRTVTIALPEARADFVMASATDVSAIPGAEEGSFDVAMCVYVFCNLLSKDEVKQALLETYKMLKPGGKLIIYETHVTQYMQ